MKYLLLTVFLTVALSFACKKKKTDEPVNKEANTASIDCAVCPSVFYGFAGVTEVETTSCDDFTAIDLWPTASFAGPQIVGFTQEITYPITILSGGFVNLNTTEDNPGFYGLGNCLFEMSGEEQIARFAIYGIYAQFGEMRVGVNGSDQIGLTDEFPTIINDVLVEFDSITTEGAWTQAYLTFTGEIESVEHQLFESGVTELCVTTTALAEAPAIDTLRGIYFTDFFLSDGTSAGYFPTTKTPTGYYGNQGVAMQISFDEFLAYSPTAISFVHAHPASTESLLNVQLPGTPFLVLSAENLSTSLAPYNFEATVFSQTEGTLWLDETTATSENIVVDSIVIKGTGMDNVRLGVNLNNSELRSVCTYYEE